MSKRQVDLPEGRLSPAELGMHRAEWRRMIAMERKVGAPIVPRAPSEQEIAAFEARPCGFCNCPMGQHPQPDYWPCPVAPLNWPSLKERQ